jgi:SM-20-related protein
MPLPEFFRKLGLFVVTDFLDAKVCSALRAEMCDAPAEKGEIVGDARAREEGGAVVEAVRRVSCVSVAKSARLAVTSKLEELKSRLEAHFQVPLDECDGPHFLVYDPDSFYKPHQDASPGAPQDILRRSVSLVIFLNTPAPEPASDGYGGGDLTFYGLLPGSAWEKCPLRLEPSLGLLVAFRPDIVHEVKPVTFGHRFTIVAWFLVGPERATSG